MQMCPAQVPGWLVSLVILATDSPRGGEGCSRATLLQTHEVHHLLVCAHPLPSPVRIHTRREYAYYALVLNTVLRSMSVMKYAYYERTLE